MKDLPVSFKQTIKEEGRSLIWFQKNYIPELNYQYMILQLNGQKSLQDNLQKAIMKYLGSI